VLYVVFGLMLALAVLIIVVPVFRARGALPALPAATVAVVFLAAVGIYSRIGTPDAEPAAPQQLPDVGQMVDSLAARLEENPDDLAGWKMLGRSYMQLENFPLAIAAFERAVAMEEGRNAQTLADLGEVLLLGDESELDGRAGQLFDEALALEPRNQKALFYAGMAAVRRGDAELGAQRWEALLATSPPEHIAAILREQIGELRGTPVAAAPAAAAPGTAGVVTASVSLSDSAAAAVPVDATVFIIARDPAQPSPPIAAVRRRVSELPAEVTIGDSDAMIPGRVPSGFAELELVARVSMSGQPVAQAGDWFGELRVKTADSGAVSIVIDQQVR